jgi:hypothetical protein
MLSPGFETGNPPKLGLQVFSPAGWLMRMQFSGISNRQKGLDLLSLRLFIPPRMRFFRIAPRIGGVSPDF